MKVEGKVKDTIQYITLNEAKRKAPNYYHITKMFNCICGSVTRNYTDLNKGKDTGEHAYQFSCVRCGRKSEPKSSRTLAVKAWNDMQIAEKKERNKNEQKNSYEC